jgi:predicted dehydrogenase
VTKDLLLIGVGKWGANFLRTIVSSKQDKLAYILTSKSSNQLDKIAVSDATLLSDLEMLEAHYSDIDCAIVATPPDVRPGIVLQLLKHNIPVLAEKPLSLDLEKTLSLTQFARSKNVLLIENFIHIYSWPYLMLREHVHAGKPLSVSSSAGHWGPFRDYTPLLDYAPHDIAMTLLLFDQMPEIICLDLEKYKGRNEFNFNIVLDFGDQGRADITLGNLFEHKQRYFEVVCDGEKWAYDNLDAEAQLRKNNQKQSSDLGRYSAMQIALDCLTGRRDLYSQEKQLWLIESVATIVNELESQLHTLKKDA